MNDTLSEKTQFHKDVDARGLNCPLPILRAKKALADLLTGQVLRIVVTDRGAMRDFHAFTKQTGNILLSMSEVDSELVFLIERK